MALINCPECNKQISDKANSCPDCGFPLHVSKEIEYEEFLCCPKCDSKDLHSEQKGFNGGKAFAGAVLTGGIGILAGTIGSKDIQITCLKCGNRFNAGGAKIGSNRQRTEKDIETEVKKIIESGNVLQAVKYYNDKTNCGITEAKHKVDLLRGVTPSLNKGGCAGVILLFIILSSLVVYKI